MAAIIAMAKFKSPGPRALILVYLSTSNTTQPLANLLYKSLWEIALWLARHKAEDNKSLPCSFVLNQSLQWKHAVLVMKRITTEARLNLG